ncbi:hypothetical protein Tco_0956145 [Tanacetum coccineum]|uniref:Uncharacterized protein n=1 Tax=Tanacetum coccineum TaxID=301880 RepID=A0ABQ5E960_9ASTR
MERRSRMKDKDLKISELKTKSKDNDKGSRSKITKHEGTSLQQRQRPRSQELNNKSNLIDLTKECHNKLTSGEIVKAIGLPQDVPITSDRRLIELENQVQCLMEAHLAPTQPDQVNKVTTSCEICSGPHDTQNCMEDPEQAFVEYASFIYRNCILPIFLAGLSLSTCQHIHLFWSHSVIPTGYLVLAGFIMFLLMVVFSVTTGLTMVPPGAYTVPTGYARLSKFEADFKQQQSEMTNKIDTVLKAIIDRIAGALLKDTVKKSKTEYFPSFVCSFLPNN